MNWQFLSNLFINMAKISPDTFGNGIDFAYIKRKDFKVKMNCDEC